MDIALEIEKQKNYATTTLAPGRDIDFGGVQSSQQSAKFVNLVNNVPLKFPAVPEIPNKSIHDLMRELTGTDISRCPCCKHGTMVVVAELPKLRPRDSS